MKYIEISENEYNYFSETQRLWKHFYDYESYISENEDDTFGFLKLYPGETGLNISVYADDSGSYLKHNHPLWLYFENSKDGTFNKRLPISISYNPQLLVPENLVEISNHDLYMVENFIRCNYGLLNEYGNGNIDVLLFCKLLRRQKCLTESSCQTITEASILDRSLTGLNTEIWVDNERGLQHSERIKFKYDDEKDTRKWVTMTINDTEPSVKNMTRPRKTSNKDIERIKKFVIYNRRILLGLAHEDGNYYVDDFIPSIVMVGPNGGPLYPETLLKKADGLDYEDTVIIDCSTIGDRIYFIGYKPTEDTVKLLKLLCADSHFKYYNYETVYTEYNSNILISREDYGVRLLKIIEKIVSDNGIPLRIVNKSRINQ